MGVLNQHNTQTGKLDINVATWQNGAYTVSLTSGKVSKNVCGTVLTDRYIASLQKQPSR
ncbi:MAG: hypothetical protein U5L45_05660 [Saprospiraceae bacterium]|nr:hypothetical protein [Saprospiraceae bacterium]